MHALALLAHHPPVGDERADDAGDQSRPAAGAAAPRRQEDDGAGEQHEQHERAHPPVQAGLVEQQLEVARDRQRRERRSTNVMSDSRCRAGRRASTRSSRPTIESRRNWSCIRFWPSVIVLARHA